MQGRAQDFSHSPSFYIFHLFFPLFWVGGIWGGGRSFLMNTSLLRVLQDILVTKLTYLSLLSICIKVATMKIGRDFLNIQYLYRLQVARVCGVISN